MGFYTEVEKNTPKIYMERKRVQIDKEILRKKNKPRGITLPDLKIYYKVIVIKTVDIGIKIDK